MTAMIQPTTIAQVRQHYRDMDCQVRISRDGHVTFRNPQGRSWLEGRYVSEYCYNTEANAVFLR